MSMILPKGGTFGIWLTEKDSDVHVYVNEQGVVIGQNTDYENFKFTPLALVFNKDDTIHLQYEDEDNKPVIKVLDKETVKAELLDFLNVLKARVTSG